MRNFLLIVILTGCVLVIIGLIFLFPVCWGTTMRCIYTARVEISIALITIFLFIFSSIFPSREVQILTGFAGIMLSVLILLVPTKLIGVCQSPEMTCHSKSLPALKILGSLLILTTGLWTIHSLYKK